MKTYFCPKPASEVYFKVNHLNLLEINNVDNLILIDFLSTYTCHK